MAVISDFAAYPGVVRVDPGRRRSPPNGLFRRPAGPVRSHLTPAIVDEYVLAYLGP